MDIIAWLEYSETNKKRRNYTHRLLKEMPEQRKLMLEDLRKIVQQAHEDAKRRFKKLAGISLDPFDSTGNDSQNQQTCSSPRDPTLGYPEMLDILTLQGYFGEIFAGIIAESFSHFGISNWKVPAYPFRFHRSAFYALENWRQTGVKPGVIIGRDGDDMLAFYMDDEGIIKHALVCEAKCSTGHQSGLIAKAHKQVSQLNPRPLDVLNLIEILQDYEDPVSQKWVNALQVFFQREIYDQDGRFDLVSYICGESPVRSKTWLSTDAPHPNYTVSRKLEAVEVHLQNVETLVKEVYGVHEEE